MLSTTLTSAPLCIKRDRAWTHSWLLLSSRSSGSQVKCMGSLPSVPETYETKSWENMPLEFWDQVSFKLGSVTESGKSLDILDIEFIFVILPTCKQQTIKALIRLHTCAGWSASVLFAYGSNKFSHTCILNGKKKKKTLLDGPINSLIWLTDWFLFNVPVNTIEVMSWALPVTGPCEFARLEINFAKLKLSAEFPTSSHFSNLPTSSPSLSVWHPALLHVSDTKASSELLTSNSPLNFCHQALLYASDTKPFSKLLTSNPPLHFWHQTLL